MAAVTIGRRVAGPGCAALSKAALAFVTDFADQAVLLPVAAALLAALTLAGWRRAAYAWSACIGATLAATLLFKLIVMACGVGHFAGLASPSGHTAGAAAVYGGALGLLVRGGGMSVAVAALAAAAVAIAIGLTRVGLGVHSWADIGVGGAAGVAGAAAFRALAGERPAALRPARAGAVVLAVMALLHGRRLDAEPRLTWAAAHLWPLTLCRGAAGVPGMAPAPPPRGRPDYR